MFKFFTCHSQRESRHGVTLIEIIIVSTVIALMSAISFPVYKIIQQREKEKRLKNILLDVRAAIACSKSQNSGMSWEEGHRNYIYRHGVQKIWDMHQTDPVQFQTARSFFVASGTQQGLFFPLNPSKIVFSQPYTVTIATGPAAGDEVQIKVEQRFLRRIPPHPFRNWYPNARWEFKPAVNAAPGGPTYASAPTDPWNTGLATGVIDIVSRGAGMGLDGSNTDDW